MTILITGGTGNTGLRLARRLREANHSVLLTHHSRPVPEPFVSARFNWFDPSTYENPFLAAHDIDRIYVVCPPVGDALGATRPFLDFAVAKGVKRLVLLGGTAMPKGSGVLGKVHEYIVNLGVDYCILRPSWFIGKMSTENFENDYLRTIRDEDLFGTVMGDGRIPLISVDDIVDVAFSALCDGQSHNTEHVIVGPELFSYDEVYSYLLAALLFSKVLGRQILHKRLTEAEYIKGYIALGCDQALAEALLLIENHVAAGKEEALFHEEGVKIIGRRRLVDYVEARREIWNSN
ncbi:hypothetical protein H0H92_014332 [Tricholoma furcatifolium]|nr:hypothetical protein H0H92_014332 [Tricholoma furcatifolium]